MENESKIKALLSRLNEWFVEQIWFQQGKAKWDELDPNSKSYVKAGGLTLSLLMLMGIALSTVFGIHSLRREINEKQELLTLIQSGNEELRQLRDSSTGVAAAGLATTGPWLSFFESILSTAGIDKSNFTIGPEKPGQGADTTKEALYEISIKHLTLRQVVKITYQLENGTRPAKVRGLNIDTHSDAEGWMDATLAVSGFYTPSK